MLEVRYPWRPWDGRQVRVQALRGRNGLRVVRSTTLEEPQFPGLETPHWVLEPEAGGSGEVTDAACVHLQALRVLATLLAGSQSRQDPDVVEAQHPPFTRGDADAIAIAVAGPQLELFRPAPTLPAMPPDVYRKMVQLLARLLHEYSQQADPSRPGREVEHE